MPGLFSWKTTKPRGIFAKTSTAYRYSAIAPDHFRLIRYADASNPQAIRLEIRTFDRRAKPTYIALSYACGDQSPHRGIEMHGAIIPVGTNLYNALCYMRGGLSGWFWVDAICIDQNNVPERNQQVREMARTYADADGVASWIGLCDQRLQSFFTLDARSLNLGSYSRTQRERLAATLDHLGELDYWSRIWVQQELVLNRNIVLFCGEYNQALHPLIALVAKNTSVLTLRSRVFRSLDLAVEWFRWRKAPLLRLMTWAGHHKSTDTRDKLYALLSLVVEHERENLQPYFPDYDLSLTQVLIVAMAHIRRFSGQRRAARQLDSVLFCFGEPGDSACADVVRTYYWRLQQVPTGGSLRLSNDDRTMLRSRKLLDGRANMLDVCDCIFAQELGPEAGHLVDVRSSRTWRRSGTWGFDPPLSDEMERYWGMSMSEDMEDLF